MPYPLITSILEDLNHEIILAENGKLAIDKVAAETFDLILMDIRMPVMDGMEATRFIRSMKNEKSKIPVIALTADIASNNIKQYYECGFNDVCAKPIVLEDLLESINIQLHETIHTVEPGDAGQDLNEVVAPADTREISFAQTLRADTSFDQILEQVSDLVDQQTHQKQQPELATASVMSAEKWLALLESFESELRQDCIALKLACEGLSKDPADSRFRRDLELKTHFLKGTGGGYGYALVSTVAGDVEDLLKEEKLEVQSIHTIGRYVDALALIAEKKISGDGGNAGRVLLRGLRSL